MHRIVAHFASASKSGALVEVEAMFAVLPLVRPVGVGHLVELSGRRFSGEVFRNALWDFAGVGELALVADRDGGRRRISQY
jgi:hypothetical protein